MLKFLLTQVWNYQDLKLPLCSHSNGELLPTVTRLEAEMEPLNILVLSSAFPWPVTECLSQGVQLPSLFCRQRN